MNHYLGKQISPTKPIYCFSADLLLCTRLRYFMYIFELNLFNKNLLQGCEPLPIWFSFAKDNKTQVYDVKYHQWDMNKVTFLQIAACYILLVVVIPLYFVASYPVYCSFYRFLSVFSHG